VRFALENKEKLLAQYYSNRGEKVERLCFSDIIDEDGVRFFDIRQSKTENGLRRVPLHPFVYDALSRYAQGKPVDKPLFLMGDVKHNQSGVYRKACIDMGAIMGLTETDLAVEQISFYSGRHYYKTLLSAEGLGDVEEYFMGHKVSRDVSKRYNHLDKQGREQLLCKAREVFKAFDKRLFVAI